MLFVGSAAFAGATVQPYLSDRATVATKLNVARTAANAITTLWTYTPENMDTLADRAANYLSGDFAAQYRKFVDAIVAPNKQAKITNTTEVTGAAVESLDGPNAVAIVYTNTTSTSPLTKNIPSLKYLSYRLIMKRDQRPLAGDEDDDHHLAGFDAPPLARSGPRLRRKILHPMAVTSPVSERLTVTALLLLTFATGLADSISILVLGHVFVANMTGNVIFLGFWLAPKSSIDLTAVVVALPTFVCTTIISGRLSRHFGERTRPWITTVLATEIVSIGGVFDPGRHGCAALSRQHQARHDRCPRGDVRSAALECPPVRDSRTLHHGVDVDDRQPRSGQPSGRWHGRPRKAALQRCFHNVRRRFSSARRCRDSSSLRCSRSRRRW